MDFGEERIDFLRNYYQYLLDLRGHTVTIDVMGTQKAIAKQIIDQGGDYILALKGNQGRLDDDIRLFLETELGKVQTTEIEDQHYDVDKGHGRIETRNCFVSSQIDWLSQKEEWGGLKTVIMLEETQETKEKQTIERRFFISSLPPKAQRLSSAIRTHSSVESQVHWVLDVVFNEDQSSVRKDNAAENIALIRHITLNMLNNAKEQIKNIGLKALRKKAGWGDKTLRFILEQSF